MNKFWLQGKLKIYDLKGLYPILLFTLMISMFEKNLIPSENVSNATFSIAYISRLRKLSLRHECLRKSS